MGSNDFKEASVLYLEILEANKKLLEQPGIVGKMLTVDNWIEELQDKLADLQ
jgi:glycine cleavage system H lipoate-binding protein